ncbi:MAG TPA: transporter substrate-binding domain-containing protein [Candidatus Pullichristensenella stercorigallinarum]|uniref:Transporter substrate-binding domain-containing protein n=1 Tax=Candidatus Pullichristensenella stercorigallinarum TaxID=2840909 RepID=A0A9D1CXR4_9FIRM|nr:transporter substrate-binding domain-containing protein [Candidatus Pullichristensenella stercorigallinarum]
MKKILCMLLAVVMVLATASFAFAEEESDAEYILGKGTLNIGITLFAPINYEDPETGDLVGFDTEFAKAVCADLGIEPNFIVISWDAKEIELNSKSIDCIWNGMCITPEREENMSISDPYLLNTQAMVMQASREEEIMADVSGYTVVAEQGSTGEGKLQGTIEDDETVVVSAQEYFADCTYIPVGSMANALLEVKSGTADIALVDSVCALGMVRPDSDYADLVVNMDNNFGDQFYGIAFRKGSDFTAMVNESIAKLKEDGTVAELAEKYGLTDALIQD